MLFSVLIFKYQIHQHLTVENGESYAVGQIYNTIVEAIVNFADRYMTLVICLQTKSKLLDVLQTFDKMYEFIQLDLVATLNDPSGAPSMK